jgi:hypothetical protein
MPQPAEFMDLFCKKGLQEEKEREIQNSSAY